MGQPGIVNSNQKVFGDSALNTEKNIVKSYIMVYETTLTGSKAALELLKEVTDLYSHIVRTESFSQDFLSQFNLNSWNADGTRNEKI